MTTTKYTNIAVIGAGNWGTTLANLLADKGLNVDLWVREEEVYQQIKQKRINETFLPGIELATSLNPVKSFKEALYNKDLALMVVPSNFFRGVLENMKQHLQPGIPIISATKGIENDTLKTMSQVSEEVLSDDKIDMFSCLAGPSFANEVVRKLPTAITIASRNIHHAEELQQLFSTEYFRVYANNDLIGLELCGALKNVIAIAAGASDGLKFGLNARAALITRGLVEITRLGVAMGANPMTFAGLAGMGDLVLTCTGDLSRNRTVGLKIGQGKSLDEIVSSMHNVAEGVKTSKSAYQLSKRMNIDMPIITQVYEILYEKKDPRMAVKELMTRELKREIEN